MDKLIIAGGRPFSGSMQVAGAKNAALPILAASMLGGRQVRLSNLPDVGDVRSMLKLLGLCGVETGDPVHGRIEFSTEALRAADAPYDIMRKMRASL